VGFKKKKKSVIHFFPVYGCVATGLIYATIGVIALLSFFKVRHGGADESSMLALINEYIVGEIFIWIIMAGIACYVIWRFYEGFTDPYGYGSKTMGILKRIGICFSTVPDIMIGYTAISVLLGIGHIMLNGHADYEQQKIATLLDKSWGNTVVIVLGLLILITAVMQLIYGIGRGYKERITMDHLSKRVRIFTHVMALCGYIARGVIVGIIGFFLITAGVKEDAAFVVNTNEAFDFIGDEVGHLYFISLAIGTFCYGIFMFILATAYNTDKNTTDI
jgi:hypothetical protein